ncbi:MAG: hypothetical protein KAT39_15500 [Alphaproteobacteria bacterium]|nr:hypothetical protein [Alphaproteobacteria bacterium]
MRATISLALFVAMTGCASRPPPITIDEPPPPVVCTQQPHPDRLDLIDTPPLVVFDTESEVWGYWFSPTTYADIAENLQSMRRYQRQLRAVGLYFQSCIGDHNRRLAETNGSE